MALRCGCSDWTRLQWALRSYSSTRTKWARAFSAVRSSDALFPNDFGRTFNFCCFRALAYTTLDNRWTVRYTGANSVLTFFFRSLQGCYHGNQFWDQIGDNPPSLSAEWQSIQRVSQRTDDDQNVPIRIKRILHSHMCGTSAIRADWSKGFRWSKLIRWSIPNFRWYVDERSQFEGDHSDSLVIDGWSLSP